MDEFIAARALKPKSEQAYRRDLQGFMEWTQQAWANVSRRQVAQFKQYLLQERKLAPNSVNRILRTLKTFYKWMLESEYISSDPTTGVKQEKVPEAQSKELEDEEVEQIYAAIEEVSRDPVRDRALFSVLLHGLRAEEVINLNLEDYDGQQVVIREAKHDSVGEVPLIRQARLDLDAYVQQRQTQAGSLGQELTNESPLFVSNSNRSRGQRLTYWGVGEVMKQLAEYTGIDLHAHRGRHTFCTNLIVKLEMDTALAMELSRHRDIRSFKRYTNRKNKLAAKRAFFKATGQLQ
ncbi:tyrosine-type recombinase/integrase [Cyanobacteria bacterium FACHB-471]|nr:tyrosine-type recombinase/integrase [Cyanobacteria bacterium FACHB-471]